MKKKTVSILITSFNKSKFLKKTIDSCIKQNFQNKEILVFYDCSKGGSLEILNKIKKVKIIKNKKKKYSSSPLNQIYGIKELFKISKGEIIFLLDGDDKFKKDKLSHVFQIFKKNKKIHFIQDKPFLSDKKKFMSLKKKNHLFSIWPSFYPTSCMALRRSFFAEFIKYLEENKFPNLEIDARLSMFAYLKNEFSFLKRSLTIYNYDEFGITSNYKKYYKNWWKKRNEAFSYLIFLTKKLKVSFRMGPDFYLTRLINFFII